MKEYRIAGSTMIHASQLMVRRPILIHTPMMWRNTFTVASMLFYLHLHPIIQSAASVTSAPVDASSFTIAASDLCRLLILSASHLRKVSRNLGDNLGFSLSADLHVNGELHAQTPALLSRGNSMNSKRNSMDGHLASKKEKRSRVEEGAGSGSGVAAADLQSMDATTSIAQILATMSTMASIFDPFAASSNNNPSKAATEPACRATPLVTSSDVSSIRSEISNFDASDDSDDDDLSAMGMHEDKNNSSFRSIDTGVTSLDSSTMLSVASTTSESTMKLSSMDLRMMAALLNLHLYGLADADDLTAMSLSSHHLVDVAARQHFLESITNIVIDVDPLQELVSQQLQQSENLALLTAVFHNTADLMHYLYPNQLAAAPAAAMPVSGHPPLPAKPSSIFLASSSATSATMRPLSNGMELSSGIAASKPSRSSFPPMQMASQVNQMLSSGANIFKTASGKSTSSSRLSS
jgi:hypothetical protein